MSTAELTREWARELERLEGRDALARKLKLAPGTLENLSRGRLKGWRNISDRVRAYFINAITKEIGRLNHELEVAHRSGRELDPALVAKARCAIAKAQELIAED